MSLAAFTTGDRTQPIVVTGAAGQLGQTICHAFSGRWPTVAFTRAQLDVTRSRDVTDAIGPLSPGAIVNCSAFNAVDAAEDDPEQAFLVNAIAVQNLARCAETTGAVLVHYSTDFVFDGETDRPYTEDDRPRPRGTYAASKLVGEWLARDASEYFVLRVESLFGGVYKHGSSVDRIVQTLQSGNTARVFVDRVASPSYVFDVAEATWHLLTTGRAPGLYHCVNTGQCTWLELGQEIARVLELPPRLEGIRMADMPLRAPRPKFCSLSNDKLARAGMTMPTWQSALARHLKPLGQNSH